MARELSPQIEQRLASVVAGGLFPSEEAALEAAIAALRGKTEPIPFVPDEHLDLVEQRIASARAGREREFTDADWETCAKLPGTPRPENRPPAFRAYPKTVGDWLILRCPGSKMCLSPSLRTVFG
jgi:hypothetical protein